VNKMRISLSEKDGHIKGTIELPNDSIFVLESLILVLETMAKRHELTTESVAADLYRMATGKVNWEQDGQVM
jgi:hypothetical protein